MQAREREAPLIKVDTFVASEPALETKPLNKSISMAALGDADMVITKKKESPPHKQPTSMSNLR